MLKKMLACAALVLLLTIAVRLLNKAVRHRKQNVLGAASRAKARQIKDSTFSANNIDSLRTYTQAVCLQFHGRPLLTIGQPLGHLPAAFKYRYDGEFEQLGAPFMQEYISFDTYYEAANSATGPNGSLLLMTDDRGRIFGLQATWVIASVLTNEGQRVARQEITRWLPCLRGQLDFGRRKRVVVAGQEFNEVVEMVPATDSTWGEVNYEVHLNPHWAAAR